MSSENITSIQWSPAEIAKLIQRFRSLDEALYSDACPTESLLKGVLYILLKIHGLTFSLSMKELIEFISMESLCALASEEDSTLEEEDKSFIKVLLKSIPEFEPKARPDRQDPRFNRVISNVHALIVSRSAERITPSIEQLSKANSTDES